MYPDQSHSLPRVRQHQYLAMEDFFDGSFEAGYPSISRNQDMYSEMDNILYGNLQKKPKISALRRQQKANLRRHRQKINDSLLIEADMADFDFLGRYRGV